MSQTENINDVQAFWNTEACGTHFVQNYKDDREFYERYREFRYKTEWHIPLLVPFASGNGKKVLEIGCGNGADGVMWAKNDADYTGVDLTEAAVKSTRRHFEVLALQGHFQNENAEALSFRDKSFDIVYSHGVLHHSPHPEKTFEEVRRVLKEDGQAIIMLYHKNSFNYYVRILGYMRLRALIKILTRLGKHKSDAESIGNNTLKGVRGNEDKSVWMIHYESFLSRGWNYLKAENFVHRCTDGPECPYAYVFSKKDIGKIFSGWSDVKCKVAHLPIKKYGIGKWIPFWVEKLLASWWGWYLFIYAKK